MIGDVRFEEAFTEQLGKAFNVISTDFWPGTDFLLGVIVLDVESFEYQFKVNVLIHERLVPPEFFKIFDMTEIHLIGEDFGGALWSQRIHQLAVKNLREAVKHHNKWQQRGQAPLI